MTLKFTAGAMLMSLFAFSGIAKADDQTANPVTHPEVAYDQHAVKSDAKEVQKDNMKATELSQSTKEQKERLDQARKDYEKSLKDLGAESPVTKEAKSRYDAAQKDYHRLARKHQKAMHEMNEDQKDLNKAKSELEKDKAEATQ